MHYSEPYKQLIARLRSERDSRHPSTDNTCSCPVDHGQPDDDELEPGTVIASEPWAGWTVIRPLEDDGTLYDDDELEPLTRIADIDPTARARLVDILERRILRRP